MRVSVIVNRWHHDQVFKVVLHAAHIGRFQFDQITYKQLLYVSIEISLY